MDKQKWLNLIQSRLDENIRLSISVANKNDEEIEALINEIKGLGFHVIYLQDGFGPEITVIEGE